MRLKHFRVLLTVAMLTACAQALAQVKYNNLAFKIDSLSNVGLPKSALKEVDRLDQLARKENNAAQIVKATIYRLTFQTYIEDDALVSVITTLQNDINRSGYPVKPVLQSLLANMYWQYDQDKRYEISERSKIAQPGIDFRTWDLSTIISATTSLYQQSLADAEKEQATPIDVLNGVLSGNKKNRFLRPTLYDLLLHRALGYFLAEEPAITKPRLSFSLDDKRFFSDGKTFAALNVATTDSASTLYRGIKYLQQASAFHLQQHNGEALADLNLIRFSFLYHNVKLKNTDSLYLAGLGGIAADSSAKSIRADALVELASYFSEKDSLAKAIAYLQGAVTQYPGSFGAKNAASAIKDILHKEIDGMMEDINVPDKPILALLGYRNIDKATYQVYQLTDAQQACLQKLGNYDAEITSNKASLKYLKSIVPLQTGLLNLPGSADYRKHHAEFKIAPLKPGTYLLLVKPSDKNDSLAQLTDFSVSGLACIRRSVPGKREEIRVIDRETGEPFKGVEVTLNRNDTGKKNKKATIKGVTDAEGKFVSTSQFSDFNIILKTSGDKLVINDQYTSYSNDTATDSADKKATKTLIFTDRQLYRPGQTVYLKALQIEKANGKSSVVPNQELALIFRDQNLKQLRVIKLKTNEFGSVASSFVIPQNIQNGNLLISGPNGEAGISVEEYKRPTFKIDFAPVTKNYRLNDSVTIKGNVSAFSGYGLAGARVAYHISRTATSRKVYSFQTGRKYIGNNERITEIATDTLTTDGHGGFSIKFGASEVNPLDQQETDVYTINVDVTDMNNETQSSSTIISLSANPLKLTAEIPETLLAGKRLKTIVSLSNLNNEPQNGNLSIQITALKSPGVFKERKWLKPDQFLMSQSDFKSSFPFFAYGDEDEDGHLEAVKKIIETAITLKEGSAGIDLGELLPSASGMYRILLTAKTAHGDTVSSTKYVNYINGKAPAQKRDNWIVPVNTELAPGGSAEFLIGINKSGTFLLETYSGAKLLSSRWLPLDADMQKRVTIPVPPHVKNSFDVQFIMINSSRVYKLQQRIIIRDTVKGLRVKFLTFRNKLQPGQKEQWKLQVSGANERQSAEMLAGMYDASLDNIVPARRWDLDLFDQPVVPLYFGWDNGEISKMVSTGAEDDDRSYPDKKERGYEQLDMHDFDYYGDYNSAFRNYPLQTAGRTKHLASDRALADLYTKNAALVKNGFDVVGRVVSSAGGLFDKIGIRIDHTKISTATNWFGYFRIKVPYHAKLIFSFKGLVIGEAMAVQGIKPIIVLPRQLHGPPSATTRELMFANPGQKEQKGDPNSQIRIDEPTGSADIIEVQEDSVSPRKAIVRFPPPVIKPDNEIADHYNGYKAFHSLREDVKPIPIRKSFAETAFFDPQLHIDEKGQVVINFTMPESLTQWKFRAFAHTKDVKTGYLEREVITQKEIMISANTPRFLREGDTVTLTAKAVNLTTANLKARVKLQLFNALNMQPVNLLADPKTAEQEISITSEASGTVLFKLVVAPGLNALTYRLTAVAGNHSDGEENTLPVLPNSTLVTESMPVMLRPGKTQTFSFDKLLNPNSTTLQNKTLTFEFTQYPVWSAIQSLPYLMEFPYECSEQVFSRYYANSFATAIVSRYPQVKQVFEQWKNAGSEALLSNLETNPGLKSALLEETPWLRDAASQTEQKKRIALLFDLKKTGDEQEQNLLKLFKKQLPNGGFPWFAGQYADRYITQHILAGIGQLMALNIAPKDNVILDKMSNSALAYLDKQLNDDELDARKINKRYFERPVNSLEIHAWYARSYFKQAKQDADIEATRADYLTRAAKQWYSHPVYEQGMIALTLFRYHIKETTAAIVKSLLERARQSDELGMYWAENRAGYYWNQSPVEMQALMIELFTETASNPKAVEEMKIWLLRNKQTNNWGTTKATTAACYALLSKTEVLPVSTPAATITIDGRPLSLLKPDITEQAGSGYIKTSWVDGQIKPSLGKITIANHSKTINWGAMYWQYTEKPDKITSSNTSVQLKREYFILKHTDAGDLLTAVDAQHHPKTGDLIKVVIYMAADRDFDYIHLKDMRPSGTEPADALSSFKYQDGLYYYQEVKDAAINFFFDHLKKGNYVFEYSLRAVQPGNYATGITTLQSMYAPEFGAHSNGARMVIER